MTNPVSVFMPSTVETLGWTLVHFIWQGAALAGALYVVATFCRTALARYTAGITTLTLMICSPIATFLFLKDNGSSGVEITGFAAAMGTAKALLPTPAGASSTAFPVQSADWLGWFVFAWCTGVVVFGVRSLGGWFLLEQLRR